MNTALSHDWYWQGVPENVVLGKHTWLYSTYSLIHFRSQMEKSLTVGNDTGIYDGTFFDLGPCGRVTIGNYCTIVGAIFSTNSFVEIGDYALIAHEVVIADRNSAIPPCDRIEKRNIILKQHGYEQDRLKKKPSIRIGSNSWIGAGCIILGGANIGENTIVGAATVVDFPVPPNSLVYGNPSKIVSRDTGNFRRRMDS